MTTTVELGVEVGFRLDDPVAGVLNNTTYTLGQTTYLPMTDYVYSVAFTRGKNRDLDRFNAGTCQVTLNNQSRVFDPYNYASAFSGNILPRRRVRVQTDGVTQFDGSIDDWNFDYATSGESTASISASDDFSLLARQELSGVAVPQEFSGERVARVLSQSTVGWPTALRNIDTGKSVLAAETPTGNALDYLQTVTDSEQGKLFIGKNGALNFIDRTSTPTTPTVSTLTRTNLQKYWAVASNSAYFTLTGGSTILSWVTNTAYASFYAANIADYFQVAEGSGSFTNNGIAVTAGTSYNAAFVFSGVGYGIDEFGGATTVYSTVTPKIEWLNGGGSIISTSTGTAVQPIQGANYLLQVTASAPVGAVTARMGFTYVLPAYPFSAYSYFTFFGQYASAIFQDASAPGYAYGGYFDGNTRPTVEIYFDWTGTEGASTSEMYTLTPTTDPIIFSDAGDIPFTSAAVNFGTEMMFNQSEVSSGAGTAIATNRSSQLEYGITSTSLTTLVATTSQLTDLANFIVARYANPEYRFESVTVNLDSLGATFRGRVLALEIGDIAEVQFTPNELGNAISQTSSIIGISHDVRPDRHDITFSFEVLPFTFLVLDDLVYGKLDYVGVLGF